MAATEEGFALGVKIALFDASGAPYTFRLPSYQLLSSHPMRIFSIPSALFTPQQLLSHHLSRFLLAHFLRPNACFAGSFRATLRVSCRLVSDHPMQIAVAPSNLPRGHSGPDIEGCCSTDPTSPKEKYSMELGDRGTNTEATWDHRAFLFHAPTGLVVFPIQLRKIRSECLREVGGRLWRLPSGLHFNASVTTLVPHLLVKLGHL
eukprot:3274748-Rhodomonas_salina.1